MTEPRLYWGVLVGLLLGLGHFLHQRLHPRIIEVGLHPDGSLRDRHLWHLPLLAPDVLALRMDSELDFASAAALENRAATDWARHPQFKQLALLAQPMNQIDITGVEAFARLERMAAKRGGLLHIVGMKLPVEQRLKRAGLLQNNPRLRLYRTATDFLPAMAQQSAKDTIEYSI